MREEIAKVLNDESIATNEEKLDAITKSLATLVIPKDTYNDFVKRFPDVVLMDKYYKEDGNYTKMW